MVDQMLDVSENIWGRVNLSDVYIIETVTEISQIKWKLKTTALKLY